MGPLSSKRIMRSWQCPAGAARAIRDIEQKTYDEMWRELGLCIQEKKRLRGEV